MRLISQATSLVLLFTVTATAQAPISLAHLKVMTSGGFAAPLAEVLPEFERVSGISVEVARGGSQGPGPDTIRAQLRRKVSADMVIMSREGLNDLIAEGGSSPIRMWTSPARRWAYLFAPEFRNQISARSMFSGRPY